MQDKIPLSVAVITKNEQENLPGCLDSVAFAQQIVVVDSGSSDDTCRIASDLGCDVFSEDWRGFGPQKQYALDRCRHDWVLVLDADERVPQQTARVIRSLIQQPARDIAGYSFPRKNFFQGRWVRHGGWWPDRVTRLFLREKGRMTDAAVHEAVVVNGTVEALGWPLEHLTESDFSAILQKI
ncbi:MAG: glycosyltransferase family 2 protein, partial [Deltaproteobacteria bacterium]|nr:glycosyltransferase family 2 protein [Deltaproteobacteria bacterium]